MRRLLASLAIVVLLGLALTLLWRVYEHHRDSEPYSHEPNVIAPDTPAA
ncbi:MAG TPA: hypothetical protein VFN10_12305 [Thermoanaerobaculia bacterium]|nr:hypothetical protein [Thermoanaerobaculia bacterium]